MQIYLCFLCVSNGVRVCVFLITTTKRCVCCCHFCLAYRLEVHALIVRMYGQAVILTPLFFSAKLMIFASYIWLTYTDVTVTVERVFITLGILNSVKLGLHLFVPFAFQQLGETATTVSRIQVFTPLPPPFCRLLPPPAP